jgi:2-polyprenyl-6-methoxyphenol hydroxylase-like FAD-dependent oxidoreductase
MIFFIEGVTATLENLVTNTTETVRAKFMVAADGCHSSVRKSLDISFEGI